MHVVSDILPGRDRQPQIDIPKRYRKLTFLTVTNTYVRTYIARIDPSFKASR